MRGMFSQCAGLAGGSLVGPVRWTYRVGVRTLSTPSAAP